MNIDVRLLQLSQDAPRLIAISSKVSLSGKVFDELKGMSDEEVEVWIRETYRRAHFSPWEHASYTFLIDGLSRVATHQLVRHRVASYTQQSHRYSEGYLRRMALKASEQLSLGCPEKPQKDKKAAYLCYAEALRKVGPQLEVAKIGFVPPPVKSPELWARQVVEATATYYELLARGTRREDARYVIPDSVRTRIVVTMNARELIQVFFPLRMCTRAQWEIRHIAWKLWAELMKVHPQLWKYAGPSCVFRENTEREEPAALEEYLRGQKAFGIRRCPELVENKAIPTCLANAYMTLNL
ncbi:MAG: FAD-dependent thymidylate synthase [Acidilobaceae archaeon]|nr:FAD-dependent thymidylate synthase [Acidilobaceae archaeon]MCX8166016.1 FAD-dependent thymidylate synthase [Acidilobaceae archaeon]MDW7974657.1 FAD-dependent thymidylate synthase [Sulfolobales archaeon]